MKNKELLKLLDKELPVKEDLKSRVEYLEKRVDELESYINDLYRLIEDINNG